MGRTACTEPQCLYKGALYLTTIEKNKYQILGKKKLDIRGRAVKAVYLLGYCLALVAA